MPTRVAIVGVTGYAGGELARLVLRHPEARLVAAVARSHQGQPLRDVQPHLHGAPDSLVVGSDVDDAEVALKAGLVTEDVIVDAKSGASGAGHAVEDAYLFGTIDESVRPYGVPRHRHTPEIAQEAAALLGKPVRLTFTPHLVPMNRGLVASCYASLRPGKTAKDVAEAYAKEYSEEPFVRAVDSYPATKAPLGSNWCVVHALVDEE